MLVGVLADTHDNLPKVARVLQAFRERGVAYMLHAGDFVAPFTLRALVASGLPLVGVFGNNDGERAGLAAVCPTIHPGPFRLELAHRTILLAHDPGSVVVGEHPGVDVVICGHTHEPRLESGPPMRLNPGEVSGWLTGRCSAALLDLAEMKAEMLDLGRQEGARP
jgi:putative phosphoesterase